MRGGRGGKRGGEGGGRLRGDDKGADRGGESRVAGSAREEEKGSKQTPEYSSVFFPFFFLTTNPGGVLSLPLSAVKTYIYPSQISAELKANLLWELFLDAF